MTDDLHADRDLTTADLAAAATARHTAETTDRETDRVRMDEHVVDHQIVATHGRPVDIAADAEPLLPNDVTGELRTKWNEIQAGFVDEPRKAVERADNLVADAIQRLAESFAGARARLEQDWDRGDDVSTEDLRLTLQKYRSFFGRLLEV